MNHNHIPTIQVVDLTPALAQELLDGQAPNRREKEMKVQQFVRDMVEGRWMFTGEAIKKNDRGQMIDGQNRCRAVVRSGVTIQVLMISGLDSVTQSVMDTGTARSVRDALTFAGHSETKNLAAAISTHRAWTSGAFIHCMASLGAHSRATNSEALEYVAAHPSLSWAADKGARIYHGGLRLPVGSIATAILETMRIDADASADFFSRISELRTTGHGDPVATLLKRVTTIRDAGGRPLPATGLFLLFRTWNAYRDGEPLTKFQLGAPARDGAPATWAKIPEPK